MFHLNNKCRESILITLMILVLIFFVTFITLTYKEDEEVTMGFMNHGFMNIINIDSLDVHPPLYYLFLKVFLSIFTFWTKSLVVKTIFARLFSIIIFLFVIYVYLKILSLSHIHINVLEQLLLFCLMPSILEVATHLRMYELTALAIGVEYYNLKKFFINGGNTNIILIIIASLLASYTHYFVAIISGVLIIIFILKECYYERFVKSIKLFVSGIIIIIGYIPMIPYVYKQFINRGKFSAKNGIFDPTISAVTQLTAAGSKIKELFNLVLFLILISVTFVLIKHIHNKLLKSMYHDIGVCVLLSIIIEVLISLFYKQFFECRFIFPLVSIYFFLLVSTVLYFIHAKINITKWMNRFCIMLFILSSILIGASDVNKLNQNINQYDLPSVKLINQLKNYKKFNVKNVNVMKSKYPTSNGEALYATQMSDYLRPMHKDAIIYFPNKTNIYTECNDNKRFVHKLFNNLYIK